MNARWSALALFVITAFIPPAAQSAATANARAFSLGFWFGRGPEDGGMYSLDLTTLTFGVNGEVATDFFTSTYTHCSYLQLNDELFGGYMDGWMELNIPPGVDMDGNGYNDFFETAQAGSGNSSGVYSVPGYASGSVQASWNRPAGSHLGTCVLRLRINPVQTLVFRHQFMLYEFTGPIFYTAGNTNVSGWLDLAQSGVPDRKMGGLAEFVKSPTNKFNLLNLNAGTWTNSDFQVLSFFSNDLTRNLSHSTNYFAYLDFEDGDLNSADPDYLSWALVIDDPNDADGDKIPDFSDELGGPALPRQPVLSLSATPATIKLTIAGDQGRVHQILESSAPDFATYQTNQTVTLSTDPQDFLLSLPVNGTRFFRVRAW